MKILSIDFDYFQDVSRETLLKYPDGVDLPTQITNFTWGSKYACYGDEIRNIGIIEKEFEFMKHITKNQSKFINVAVCNSHVNIYNFINYISDKEDEISIVNVDMHHDMFNDSNKLDCGNWLGYIKEEYKRTKIKWIQNPVSLEMYGMKDVLKEITSLEDIKDEYFDALFLCRSDNWTPPHLDCYFTELYNIIQDKFHDCILEENIEEPRKDYIKIEQQEREFFEKNFEFISK